MKHILHGLILGLVYIKIMVLTKQPWQKTIKQYIHTVHSDNFITGQRNFHFHFSHCLRTTPMKIKAECSSQVSVFLTKYLKI